MGSGKSFISCIFEECGYIHFDVDKIAKGLIDKSSECKNKLKNFFGEDILDDNSNIDKKILGLKAFNNIENLLNLGLIVNPYIKREVEKLVFETEGKIIIDAATLFESGLNEFCKYKIYVYASSEIRCKRIVKRDKISQTVAMQRIKSQKEEIFFNKKCDFILNGNLDKKVILKRVSEMIIKIESR